MTSGDDDVQLRTLTPRPTDVEPSPARDALRGNLKASETDPGLKKRKSWFGSMKDVFHKGALSAKAAVDSMRSESSVVKTEEDMKHLSLITPEPRDSLDSATSTTPLKSHTFSPQLNRRRTFSPREAVSSLRHHFPGPGTGSRRKRGSMYSIASPVVASPEHFSSSVRGRDSVEVATSHGRKGSVASSLVGSIRGLARRPTRSKRSSEPTAPVDPAEEVSLPSSPINIVPSAAPVLGLDLGKSGMDFVPAELPGAAINVVRDEETRKLQDPANFAIDCGTARQASLPLVPDELKRQFTHPAVRKCQARSLAPLQPRAKTPSEMLLKLPNETVQASPPVAPATPLPGATLAMELDGAEDSASSSGKKSQVFERSVIPTDGQRELKKMCSLDAIADSHTATRSSPAVSPCDVVQEESPAASPKNNPFSPHISIPSASTVSECPSDMPQLERQVSVDSRLYRFGEGKMAVENPFDDSQAADNGPPSPVRSVRLPLRLKIRKGFSDERVESTAARRSLTGSEDRDWLSSEAQYNFESPTKLTTSPLSSNHPFSDDDTMARARDLRNGDVIYPVFDGYPLGSDETSDDDMMLPNWPVAPAPLREVEPSANAATPGKSTWKAGLGSDGFKFSFDSWRPTGTMPEPQTHLTPSRRTEAGSVDSVSVAESFETPMGSRTSQRTPTMGNKNELDARRSERNMRYNALHQEQGTNNGQTKSSSPVRMHARFFFSESSAEIDPNEAQYSQMSEQQQHQHRARVGSEDSMAMSLRSASDNMEKLRALLGEIDSDGEGQSQDPITDAFTTASSPRAKKPKGSKACGIRSDSPLPSPYVETVYPLPATRVIEPLKFSSTSARDNASPNRFTVLQVGAGSTASSASDDTVADLPCMIQSHVNKENAGSGDTLDKTIDMLSSPESGYRADDNSEVQQSPGSSSGFGSGKQLPKRYHSQSGRKGRKALGEVTRNGA